MQLRDSIITIASYISKPSKRKLITFCKMFAGKKGLEIGGPSSLFSLKGYFPVYLFAKQVDGVNYSNDTSWEGRIEEGNHYRYHSKTGYQFIREATNLEGIASASYDFVLSCHSLEHVANPLKAIQEWKRVLKPSGLFVLVLPDKRYTFDIKRPYTKMSHLLEDYKMNRGEDDSTHFAEVLELHEFGKDAGADSLEILKERLKTNLASRYVHHHVFNFELVDDMLTYFSFERMYQQEAPPFHLITIARKSI